ncbi:MAG: DNA-processing protein DprA [Acidimicrobiales bacterium]
MTRPGPRQAAPPAHPTGPAGGSSTAGEAGGSPQGAEIGARLALAGLSRVGPARLDWLLGAGSAIEAVDRLRSGRLPSDVPAPRGVTPAMVAGWRAELDRVDPERLIAPYRIAGIAVLAPADPGWPFPDDPEPPILAFVRGRSALASEPRRRVAIVGTRRCTTVGEQVARRLGAELAAAGVVVVSGLATGIDGAAHRGALAAADDVLAVVGTGLDTVYPRANRALWATVAERGAVLSEAPLGVGPERWRFPARNRLIAGLADAVVVVESHDRGGSLHTVDEAVARGRPVLVVPGAVTSSASAGSNRLLVDGAVPVCSAADVLAYLGWPDAPVPPAGSGVRPGAAPPDPVPGGTGPAHSPALPAHEPSGPDVDPLDTVVRAEAATGSVHIDDLVAQSGRPVVAVLAAVERLAARGEVVLHGSTVVPGQPTRQPDDGGVGGYAPRP